MAPRIQSARESAVEGIIRDVCPGVPPRTLRGSCRGDARGVRELRLVPLLFMHFHRFRYAEMQVCFYSAAPHVHHSEAERVTKLSLERSRLPCGPDFPQTLLTCRRPVFPPRPGAVVFMGLLIRRSSMLRLVSWNINSIRLRVDNVRQLVAEWAPDALC